MCVKIFILYIILIQNVWLKKQPRLINPFLWLNCFSFQVNKVHINVCILVNKLNLIIKFKSN